jgi:hypothetical protein
MTYACPAWEIEADNHLVKPQRLQNRVLRNHWEFSKAHNGSRLAHGFQTYVNILLCNKIMQATSRSHTKS